MSLGFSVEKMEITLDDKFVEEIYRVLEDRQQYKKAAFDRDTLANRLGVSLKDLDSYIMDRFEKGVWDFLAEYRIQKIIEVLDKEIIHKRSVYYFKQSGFQSKVSFDRVFKRVVGVSLENYVKKLKADEDGSSNE